MSTISFEFENDVFTKETFVAQNVKNSRFLAEAKRQLKRREEQLSNPSAPMISDDLGWLHVDEWASDSCVTDLLAKAKDVREHADVFVLIGVGGSNQAARAVIKALQTDNSPDIVYLGNNTSPHYLNQVLKQLEGKSVYINLIAKNFETLEPGIGFRVMRQFLTKKYGDAANERIFVTGTKESYLDELSQKHQYCFLEFPENVGGRYSVLTSVGLFPMAVAGIDIEALVRGARAMQDLVTECSENDHIALNYATYRNLLLDNGYHLEMLANFEPQYDYFSKWWVQLFAESEGKEGKGIYPITASYSEDLHSIGQYVQDGQKIIFETFIQTEKHATDYQLIKDHVDDRFDYLNDTYVSEINQAVFEATYRSHNAGGIPTSTLIIPELNEYYLGQLFYFFMFSCYLSGSILGIDPFDQPGVEKYKQLMFDKLGKNV